MSELQVEGLSLKKLLKKCKKSPLPFGYNPSPKVPECYLAMHLKKSAKIVGKDAKDEGPSEKAAFGTIKVEDKMLILNCERIVPNLAKSLKKYLKSQKVMLNVEVRDASGKVLESDVEDGLPDDPELDGDDETDTGINKDALAKRLAELRKRIQALDAKAVEKFTPPYAKVVGMFKKDALEKCAKGADQIEAALPKPGGKAAPDPALAKLVQLYKKFVDEAANIQNETSRTNIQKALAQVATHLKAQKAPEATALLTKIRDAIKKIQASAPDIPDAPAPPDPKLIKLTEMLNNFQNKVGRVTDDALRGPIENDLKLAAELLKSGDVNKTTAALIKIRDALKIGIAAAKQAHDQQEAKRRLDELSDAPDEPPLTGQQAKEFEAWTKVHKELSGTIDNALTKGLVADVDGLRKNWNWAVSNAVDKKYAEALAAIPAVRKMLAAGTEDGKSVFNEDIPADAKPFAESRVRWSFARSKMQGEMDKLKSSIISAVKDDEELSKEIGSSINVLTQNLEKLDDRLENKLDQIVNEAAGQNRENFKNEAKKLIGEYQKELATDFFQDVDSNSGFASVAILATAQKALGAIETVLK